MPYSDSRDNITTVEENTPVQVQDLDREFDHSPKPVSSQYKYSPRRWLTSLGVLLVLVSGGLGWRWWQSSQAGREQSGPAAAGAPMAIPVNLETLQTANLRDSSEFVGSLESRRSVVLKPEITGRVTQILVQPGDTVAAGTPLIQLSPDKRQAELASVLAGVSAARAARANAQSQIESLQAERNAQLAEVELQDDEYRRIVALVKEGALPQQQLDRVVRDRRRAMAELNGIDQRIKASRASLGVSEADLQQAQANVALATAELQDATIVAPFAGTVSDIPVKLGDIVSNTDNLTTVTQNQILELRLAIPLERSPELRQGQRVELVDSQGKVLSSGQISFIDSQVNSNAQSILAKAAFDNTQGRLKDGQFVRARVIWRERPGLLIPAAAISRVAGAPFVFVAQPASQTGNQTAQVGSAPTLIARQRSVQLGSIQGNRYQVLAGLKPGEQVIVSGILNLVDGAPIAPTGTP